MTPVSTEGDRRQYATARRGLAGAALVVAMFGSAGPAMALDRAVGMVAAAEEPTEPSEEELPEEQLPEQEPTPESVPAADETEEPASEPGDVSAAAWVGAILFLAAAVSLEVWQTTKNSSSDGE